MTYLATQMSHDIMKKRLSATAISVATQHVTLTFIIWFVRGIDPIMTAPFCKGKVTWPAFAKTLIVDTTDGYQT